MARLNIDQIVEAKDLAESEIEVKEWGGSVLVRGLGYGEWVDVRDASVVGGQHDETLFTRKLLAAALVDPVVNEEQATLLLGKNLTAIDRVVDEIMTLSGVKPGAVQAAEATFPG